jgi:integral membrane protein (TIGR01906 family)
VKNKILTALLAIAVALLIISASIALPIYIRPFYYAHIGPYRLEARTGQTAEDIRAAFDEVMDYLTLPNRTFGAGVFAYSEEGASHFADCKVLFTLDTVVLIASLAVVVLLAVLAWRGVFKLCRPFGAHVLLTSGGAVLSLFALLALVISLDFNTAFVIFHQLFFPGKENWVFDSATDPIINALPQGFFANCALLIGVSVIALSLGCVIYGLIERKKRRAQMAETAEAQECVPEEF